MSPFARGDTEVSLSTLSSCLPRLRLSSPVRQIEREQRISSGHPRFSKLEKKCSDTFGLGAVHPHRDHC